MQSTWDDAISAVLVHEGGYTHHPHDPGGATNKGVTLKVWNDFCAANNTPGGIETLKTMSNDTAKALYRMKYWDAVRGDQLPPGIDYCVLDVAVNSGPGRARQWVRAALGREGTKGPLTDEEIGALWGITDWDGFIATTTATCVSHSCSRSSTGPRSRRAGRAASTACALTRRRWPPTHPPNTSQHFSQAWTRLSRHLWPRPRTARARTASRRGTPPKTRRPLWPRPQQRRSPPRRQP